METNTIRHPDTVNRQIHPKGVFRCFYCTEDSVCKVDGQRAIWDTPAQSQLAKFLFKIWVT